jgi:hypothetical protein
MYVQGIFPGLFGLLFTLSAISMPFMDPKRPLKGIVFYPGLSFTKMESHGGRDPAWKEGTLHGFFAGAPLDSTTAFLCEELIAMCSTRAGIPPG